jgi:hypothetical protein
MDEERIRDAISYYIDKADRLRLPEEFKLAEEIADKLDHLEATLMILKELYDDGQ